MLDFISRETEDEYWSVYGFADVVGNTSKSIVISDIKSNSLYNFEFYCVNPLENVSNVAQLFRFRSGDNL